MRATVFGAIQEVLENLPQKYSNDDYRVKCEAVFQHMCGSYYEAVRSVYAGWGDFPTSPSLRQAIMNQVECFVEDAYDTRRDSPDIARGLRGLSQ